MKKRKKKNSAPDEGLVPGERLESGEWEYM